MGRTHFNGGSNPFDRSMIFYHGTSCENWRKIQEEGVLWGGDTWHKTGGRKGYRYTYLTPEKQVAKKYGNVLLEIEYEPKGAGSGIDNYGFNPPPGMTCWQFSVFIPIELKKVKLNCNLKSVHTNRKAIAL